jgi:hypothetical protein
MRLFSVVTLLVHCLYCSYTQVGLSVIVVMAGWLILTSGGNKKGSAGTTAKKV